MEGSNADRDVGTLGCFSGYPRTTRAGGTKSSTPTHGLHNGLVAHRCAEPRCGTCDRPFRCHACSGRASPQPTAARRAGRNPASRRPGALRTPAHRRLAPSPSRQRRPRRETSDTDCGGAVVSEGSTTPGPGGARPAVSCRTRRASLNEVGAVEGGPPDAQGRSRWGTIGLPHRPTPSSERVQHVGGMCRCPAASDSSIGGATHTGPTSRSQEAPSREPAQGL